jgi:hypothetical protein
VVSFTPRPLYPQGKSPGTHWIGGWVGSRAVLDAVMKRKIPSPRRESNPRTPIVQPVAQRYTTELSRLFRIIWICFNYVCSLRLSTFNLRFSFGNMALLRTEAWWCENFWKKSFQDYGLGGTDQFHGFLPPHGIVV